MDILNYIIADDIIKGITPLQQVTNNEGGKRCRFMILTDRYPVVIESKNFYAGFGTDEQDWPETWSHYASQHKKASIKVAQLLDEEEYLTNTALSGK